VTDLDVTRSRIVAEAFVEPGFAEVLLLEPAEGTVRVDRVTAATSPASVFVTWELPHSNLLRHWLRANGGFLEMPDKSGLSENLPGEIQQRESGRCLCGCLPLVVEEELVGWLAFLADEGEQPVFSSDRRRRLISNASAWAATLLRDREESARTAKSEATSKSNRLSVAGQMAAGVAHEVRNPLAAIRSTIQLVRDEPLLEKDRAELLSTILNDVDRVNHIVSELMVFGKPKQTRHETSDVSSIIRNAVTFCGPLARRLGITLDVVAGDEVLALADSNELRQVLVNLILNACQASSSGSRVIVSLDKESDRGPGKGIVIRVADSGSGIAPDVLDRVFDPFFSTKPDGAGLGLAISRELVQRHGGDLSLVSQAGAGTTAVLKLPRL